MLLYVSLQYFGVLKAGEALDDHLTTAFEYTYKNSKYILLFTRDSVLQLQDTVS